MINIYKDAVEYMFGIISEDAWSDMVYNNLTPPNVLPKWQNQWQPIETAPKDGTWVLVCDPTFLGGPVVYVARWDLDVYNTWIEASGEGYMSFDNATHWMPLPNPPPAK